MAAQIPDIPPSTSSVDVSVLDSTLTMGNVPGWYDMDPVYPGFETAQVPGFAFLIEHAKSRRRIMFDLGIRKDFRKTFNPQYVRALEDEGVTVTVKEEVPEILRNHGFPLETIEAVVLSHHHFDHIGNPAAFPPCTKLVVGPGFKDPAAKLMPGYPADAEAEETVSDSFVGRAVEEVDFLTNSLKIGGFAAYDYFGDGSLYILATPGHTHSHLSALARTTASEVGVSTFIFIGGDIVHHCPLFRPSFGLPLPPAAQIWNGTSVEAVDTAPLVRLHRLSAGAGKAVADTGVEPFCLTTVHHADPSNLQLAATRLSRFDAMDNVMVMFAHDSSLLDVIDFFPAKATFWKAGGWKEKCHWKFLKKFRV